MMNDECYRCHCIKNLVFILLVYDSSLNIHHLSFIIYHSSFIIKKMLCPNCNHSAQPGLTRCDHCNFKLPETALPAAAPQMGVQICWNCQQSNAIHALHCVGCNARLEQKFVSKRPAAQRYIQATPNTLSHDE
jgi:hypothetical protein